MEFIDKKNTDYDVITFNQTVCNLPSVKLELLRWHILKQLKKIFCKTFEKYVANNEKYTAYDKGIDTLMRNNMSKLNSQIILWCWHQYSNTNSSNTDYVIPYKTNNIYDYDRFMDDLNYIINITNPNDKITSESVFIKKLNKKVSDFLEQSYNNFKKYEAKIAKSKKLKINKEIIKHSVRLSVKHQYTHIVQMHQKIYDKLIAKIKANVNLPDNLAVDELIFCLYYRYSYLDAENQQLSICEQIKNIYKKIGFNFELFGSAINTTSDNYCSLFYDIEKFFGSYGNFFEIQIKKGLFTCNPPFDNTIMNNTGKKIIQAIEQPKSKVAFVITIPIWDNVTQQRIKNENIVDVIRNHANVNNSIYSDYEVYCNLKPYICDEIIVPKNKIPYFNYKHFRYINAVDSYIIIIYSKNIDEKIKKQLHESFDEIIKLSNIDYYIPNNKTGLK